MIGIEKIRGWCHAILPLVYDDSISYYEFLCKVIKKLNDIIDLTNATAEEMQEIKAYVDNYFKNLDVQDEINNKINSMLEDGSLGSLLQSLIYNYIDVVKAGVDNTGIDCTESLQAVINEHPNGTLFFRNGIYNIDGNITIDSPIEFIMQKDAIIQRTNINGFGFTINSQFTLNGGTITGGTMENFNSKNLIGNVFTSGIFLFNNTENTKISNVKVDFNALPSTFKFVNCKNVQVENCKAQNTLYGCFTFWNSGKNISINNFDFKHGKHSTQYQYNYPIATGYTDYTTEYEIFENFRVTNSSFEDCDWEGIDCHGGKNIIYSNIRMKNCNRFITCYTDGRPTLKDYNYGDVLIENCYLENEPTYTPIGTDTSMFLRGSGERYMTNVCLKNITLINPVTQSAGGTRMGAILVNFNRNVTLENIKIIITKDYEYTPFAIYGLGITNGKIRGMECINFPGLTNDGPINLRYCTFDIDNLHIMFNGFGYCAVTQARPCYIKMGNNITGNAKRQLLAYKESLLISDGENIPKSFTDLHPSSMFGSLKDSEGASGFALTMAEGEELPSISCEVVSGNNEVGLGDTYYFACVGCSVLLKIGEYELQSRIISFRDHFITLNDTPTTGGNGTLTINRMLRYNYEHP